MYRDLTIDVADKRTVEKSKYNNELHAMNTAMKKAAVLADSCFSFNKILGENY